MSVIRHPVTGSGVTSIRHLADTFRVSPKSDLDVIQSHVLMLVGRRRRCRTIINSTAPFFGPQPKVTACTADRVASGRRGRCA